MWNKYSAIADMTTTYLQ